MGTYHEDPGAVASGKIGRKLEDNDSSYESYLEQLEDNEELWLGTSNGSWDIVILLDTEAEFDHVCANRQGKGTYTFYAISLS